jgi:hypothetical protein
VNRSLVPLATLAAVAAPFLRGGWVEAQSGKPFAIENLQTVEITQERPPPEWALWERHLLENLYPAALEFVRAYTRPDGTLIWRQEWPGMDGSDDGYESFYNFPLYYALGGPEDIHALSRRLWDAVTRQFTRYGQIHKEFDGYYDWMHHGESCVYFYFFGLADPTVRKDRERALRFAGLYLNEDPEALNWDPEHRLIRSPINGSRGPRFVTTAEDWVTHRPVLAGYPLPFPDIPHVTDSSAWTDDEKFPFILAALNERMMRGDVPLNLTATSLVLNAYMYTGDEKYRKWVVDYVRAWMERVRANNGVLPDNVGLSGRIGEQMEGKWWGGYYGWRWPHGLFNLLESTTIGAANALLATGDPSFLDLPRSLLDRVLQESKLESGRRLVPHKYGDRGWYAHRPLNPQCPVNIFCLAGEAEDWQRIERLADVRSWDSFSYYKGKGDAGNEGPWISFLRGRNPRFPVEVLKATYGETLRRLRLIREDRTRPEERDVHHWQQRNPVVLEGLVQLMLGAPNHIYHGGLLHCRVRYFDPRRRRPGLPEDVAALVERVKRDGITLTLVNLHPSDSRDVIVQAGAFGEHRFTGVRLGERTTAVGRKFFHVRLAPGAAGRMEAGMECHVNRPTYAFPWHGDSVPVR